MKLKFIFPLAAILLLTTYSCAGIKGIAKKNKKTEKTEKAEMAVIDTAAILQIADKHWTLVELNGAPVSSNLPTEAYIFFNADGRVSGNLSCNSFSGVYKTENGYRIRIDNLVSTRKMCLNMSVEDELQRVLTITTQFSVTDNKLVLNRARVAPLAVFEAVSAEK
jgi:heat shock protein HslJ